MSATMTATKDGRAAAWEQWIGRVCAIRDADAAEAVRLINREQDVSVLTQVRDVVWDRRVLAALARRIGRLCASGRVPLVCLGPAGLAEAMRP